MKYFSLIIVSFLILYSCTKDKGLLPVAPIIPAGTVDPCITNISYSLDIVPIFNNSCAIGGCHVQSGYKDFSTYSTAKIEIDTYTGVGFISRFKPGGGMPSIGSPLGSCEVKKIETWINAGYPNN